MKSRTRLRNLGTNTNVTIVFGSIAAVLVLVVLLAAISDDLPLLGWVGFGLASAIFCCLVVMATLIVPRARVSAPKPAVARDDERRLLVIADSSCSELALCNTIVARLQGAIAVHLVVPVRVSHLRFLTDDESDERRDAEKSMRLSVGLLGQRGISATGSVGTDKPLESMSDALGYFPASEVLLAVPPKEESYWLERDLLAKARALTSLSVAEVVIPSTAPAVGIRAAP
jgi:hypothetical protein